MQVNILEARNQLSKLVKAALEGEDVVIANHGKPVVRLVKLDGPHKTRGYGAWKHLAAPADDWDSAETNAAIASRVLDRPIEPPQALRRTPRATAQPAAATKARSRKVE